MSNPNQHFTEKELRIVRRFLEGESIRNLVEPGWGRTRIKNLLVRYSKKDSEIKMKIDAILFRNRTHKKEDSEVEIVEISDEQIITAYKQIKSGKSLRSVSEELGRSRDYIKNRIIDYINEPNETAEFLSILRGNQKPLKIEYDKFFDLSDKDKMIIIFDKLNERRKNLHKTKYGYQLLERKLIRLKRYFLETRNKLIQDDQSKMSENDLWKMLYDMPNLLAYSFSNKIKPAMQNLDSSPSIGYAKASQIIREDPSVLASSIDRTNLQIRILDDNDLLNIFLAKPRYFRTSPELIYALIELSKSKSTDDIFITKSRLQEKYNISSEELIEKYNARDKYSDDEYFDK